jgi:hypothetical protein
MFGFVKFEGGDRQGVVTMQADEQTEVLSTACRAEALKEATRQGVSRPGLSGNDTAYPVDASGNTNDDVLMGRVPVAGYRCDFRVTSGNP